MFILCLISSIIKQNHVLDIGGYLHPLSIGITVPLSEEKNLGSKVIFSKKFNFLLFPFSKNEIKEHHSKHISWSIQFKFATNSLIWKPQIAIAHYCHIQLYLIISLILLQYKKQYKGKASTKHIITNATTDIMNVSSVRTPKD